MIYEYECQKCGKVTEAHRPIERRNECPPCESCTGGTVKVISRANVNPDIYGGYFDPNLATMHSTEQGTWVRNKQHRKELMRQHGLEESG